MYPRVDVSQGHTRGMSIRGRVLTAGADGPSCALRPLAPGRSAWEEGLVSRRLSGSTCTSRFTRGGCYLTTALGAWSAGGAWRSAALCYTLYTYLYLWLKSTTRFGRAMIPSHATGLGWPAYAIAMIMSAADSRCSVYEAGALRMRLRLYAKSFGLQSQRVNGHG